jgi:hypothetical protein
MHLTERALLVTNNLVHRGNRDILFILLALKIMTFARLLF